MTSVFSRSPASGLVEKPVQLFRGCGNVVAVVFAHGHFQAGDCFAQADDLFVGKDIPAITKQLAGGTQDDFGLFAIAGSQEEHGEKRGSFAAWREKAMRCCSGHHFLAVIQPRLVDLGGGSGNAGDCVVYGVEGGGDGGVVGPRQVGQRNLGALQSKAGLLQ
jgi:hypothetical protein